MNHTRDIISLVFAIQQGRGSDNTYFLACSLAVAVCVTSVTKCNFSSGYAQALVGLRLNQSVTV